MKKKRNSILLVLLLMLAAAMPSKANNQLTVFDDGDEFSNTSPINLVYIDEVGTRCQVIFPADALAEMNGEPINSMTFYVADEGITINGGRVRVSIAETSQTAFIRDYINDGLVQVATISFTAGVKQLVITFDEPFMYHGNNIVLDTYVEEAAIDCYNLFEGVRPTTYSSLSRGEVSKFIPKTTFDYGTNAEYAAKVLPTELTFNTVRAEREDVQTVMLKNVGQKPFTPTFNVDAPFFVDLQADPLIAGEAIDVPIRFSPVEPGDYTAVLNIACGLAGVLTVPLTAKAIQAAQDYVVCDSTDYASFVPIYGIDIDVVGTESQMIYPAGMLADMVGHQILSLRFHTYEKVEMRGGTIQLSFKIVEDTVYTADVLETGLTAVATASPIFHGTDLEFELDEPFDYNGGNLLIDCKVIEPGVTNYRQTFFYGTPMDYSCGICKSLWYGNTFEIDRVPFLPLITFSCSKDGEEPQGLRGDVNHDGEVNITDVTDLIDSLLSGQIVSIEADCNLDSDVNITDVTVLIDYLLTGNW